MEKERYYSVIDYYKGDIEVRDYESGKTLHSLYELDDLLNQQDKHIKKLTKENGRIVFVDGYDENGKVVHKQKFVKYKDTCKELIEEKRKLKQLLETQKEKTIMVYYVIKNSENKFFAVSASDYSHYWTTMVAFAHHFCDLPGHSAIDDAIEYRNNNYPDCKVVKIKIKEMETASHED